MAAIEAFHVSRTFHAMELLAIRPRSAPELAAGLGVHVRTARRLLHRLHADGYVELNGDRRRRYRPTLRIVALAGQVVDRSPVTQAALPQVAALRDELGEDCHLCVPSYLSALCLVHAPRGAEGRCRPHLRELVPCHCTAAGKALLAWRKRWREAVLTQPLEGFTERTLTGPQWLRRELERTVARGYAIEDREYQPEVRGLGAPVLTGAGQAIAAVAVVAPASRLPAERHGEVSQAVVQTARALSVDLGAVWERAGASSEPVSTA